MKPTDYELDLPSSPEEILKELNINGHTWATVSLAPHSAWVKNPLKVWFRGRYIYLIPLKDDRPAYATTTSKPNETYKETHNVLASFLSSLSWLENIPLTIQEHSGGGRPYPLGYIGQAISMLISSFDKENLPDPSDKMARKALAFYREGLSINNTFYSFLSFYKIINIIKEKGADQKNWINSKLNQLGHESQQRITELKKSHPQIDIATHLYNDGRCAIAHASQTQLTLDPDDLDELERLKKDKIIIKELSAIALEEELGIKSPKTLRKEWHHNISQLLSCFDQNQLKNGILKTTLPYIILKIKANAQNELTKKLLLPEKVNYINNTFTIYALTPDGRANIKFSIDIDKNYISIDPDYAVYKTSSIEDRINAEIDVNALVLIRDYMHGGQLRIYSNEGGLLAYGTPYRFRDLHEFRAFNERQAQIEAATIKLNTLQET